MEIGKVGFKPARGIRSAKDGRTWLALMKEELGDVLMRNDLIRIGASSLLTDIERQVKQIEEMLPDISLYHREICICSLATNSMSSECQVIITSNVRTILGVLWFLSIDKGAP
uniref:deoxyribose-phosphate aldolase-like n=1 Tax=Styela clava TaxID=7725 RepID=UPI00193A3B74|nr:deoxyribose-phosphate aldolase-like [Styela clava]